MLDLGEGVADEGEKAWLNNGMDFFCEFRLQVCIFEEYLADGEH